MSNPYEGDIDQQRERCMQFMEDLRDGSASYVSMSRSSSRPSVSIHPSRYSSSTSSVDKIVTELPVYKPSLWKRFFNYLEQRGWW
jgi:hypothetical protein